MNANHLRSTVHVAAMALVFTAGILAAGPLNPPTGPVASTYKTLTDVQPRIAINAANTPGGANSFYKISQPGSYYLTASVTGVAGKHGIEIVASGVTLDLMGFDLLGVAGSLDGVSASIASLTNITVLNGSVRHWGDEGVDLAPADACRVEAVLVSDNTGTGIQTKGGSTITNCTSWTNTGNGITTGHGSTITGCSSMNNTGTGIDASSTSGTGGGCTVNNCSASFNSDNGIITGNGSTVTNCSASANGNCGISVGIGCTVADCTVQVNALDGIACYSDCVIRANTCTGSGGSSSAVGAGIHAQSIRNRIEGNNCTDGDFGIDIDTAGNVIIRNTCADNTQNFVIASNNIFGPIINRTAPASGAVVGSSAAGTMGTTDPNANFAY